MRRERDSNPRYPFGVYTLSRRAPSTTRPSLPTPNLLNAGTYPFNRLAKLQKIEYAQKIKGFTSTQQVLKESLFNYSLIYRLHSPTIDWAKNVSIKLFPLFCPNANISLIHAASVLRSAPFITPNFLSFTDVSYLPCTTGPP